MAYFAGQLRFSRPLTPEEVLAFQECASITDPCHWILVPKHNALEWNGVTPFPGYMLALSVLYDGFFAPNHIQLAGEIRVENTLGQVAQIITGSSRFDSEPEVDLTEMDSLRLGEGKNKKSRGATEEVDGFDPDQARNVELPKPPSLETDTSKCSVPTDEDITIAANSDRDGEMPELVPNSPIPAAAGTSFDSQHATTLRPELWSPTRWSMLHRVANHVSEENRQRFHQYLDSLVDVVDPQGHERESRAETNDISSNRLNTETSREELSHDEMPPPPDYDHQMEEVD